MNLKLIALALLAACLTASARTGFWDSAGGPDDTTGLIAWYSTDKATVASQVYSVFQNRVGTSTVADLAPWDSNPATNIVSALNGYAAGRCDGSDDRYEAAITGTLNGAFHVFIVARNVTWTGGYNQFVNLNEDDLRIQEDAVTSGTLNVIRKSGVTDTGFDHAAGLPTNTWYIGSWEFNGASSRSFLRWNAANSVQAGICGTNSISSTLRMPWFFGVNTDFVEVRVYNKSMTGATETNTINRLRRKYNL